VALITGIGVSVPEISIAQDLAMLHAQSFCCSDDHQKKVLEGLYKRSGVESRASVLGQELHSQAPSFFTLPDNTPFNGPSTSSRMEKYNRNVLPLALASASHALEDANLKPSEISHLITVSCTGFFAPGFDIGLIKSLPLNNSVSRTHVGFMGCHGAMNAIKLAASIVTAQRSAKVLVCAAELCSLHFQYGWNSSDIVANSIFADGSAAVVIEGITEKKNPIWEIIGYNSHIIPESEDAMSWTIGDNGFKMKLSTHVPDLVVKNLPGWLANWLQSFGLSMKDINSWAVHPGGPRILDAVANSVNLQVDYLQPSRDILRRHGNMSSPTILFILDLLRFKTTVSTVVLGFGPGLTIEGLLLK